jgi:hypothetical protein
MTADVARRAAELLEGVTEGPWEAFKGVEESDEFRCGVSAMRGKTGYLLATIENGAPGDFCDTEWANARFIAASREIIPALLAERAALVEREQRLVAALEFYANPEVYKPHPHGPAFDDRDLSFVALRALLKGAPDA